MRSLHIIGSKRPGGAEGFFARLVNALNEAGHTAEAIVPPKSAVAAALNSLPAGYQIAMRGPWDVLARWQLQRCIERAAPDIVMTYLGRATRLVHLPLHKRPVHVARLGGYYKLQQYRHAHAWVANTRGIRDYLVENGLPAKRVYHIPNFVGDVPAVAAAQVAALRSKLRLPNDARVVLAVGRLHPAKGFDTLLLALGQLTAHIGDRPVHLILAGDGPLRDSLQSLATDRGLAGRVHWPGWQSDLAPYFALADLFVCPSRLEPFGNVLLEAWAHGVPLIATRSAGAEELVEDGISGVLVPLEDPTALAGALRDALQFPAAQRQRLIEAGRDALDSRYSKRVVVGAYLDLFRDLIATL